MESEKITHLLHVPWTGLGLYNGFRGNRWLKNRIRIFEQFVIPSMLAQTNRDFTVWCAWRRQEKYNPQVIALKKHMDAIGLKNVFTYSGICFWDDKYPDDVARLRLIDSLHGSMGELVGAVGECDSVLMTIQPSDDCYWSGMIDEMQGCFELMPEVQVLGYDSGYIMNYKTGKLAEYNPETTPPFYTIKFSRETFIDPLKHLEYTGPYKSHEYVKDHLKAKYMPFRGFVVGCHGENISTMFNHPYTGENVHVGIANIFGIKDVGLLEIKISIRKRLFQKVPYRVQRKLRYWAGERQWVLRPVFAWLYDAIRS